jgi:hypothetical protein
MTIKLCLHINNSALRTLREIYEVNTVNDTIPGSAILSSRRSAALIIRTVNMNLSSLQYGVIRTLEHDQEKLPPRITFYSNTEMEVHRLNSSSMRTNILLFMTTSNQNVRLQANLLPTRGKPLYVLEFSIKSK